VYFFCFREMSQECHCANSEQAPKRVPFYEWSARSSNNTERIISGFFFTAALALIDLGGRRMLFAGGGHPPAMVVTPSQEPRLLESRSTVLGALPEVVSQEATLDVNLRQGDRIVLYSDGITEVFNSRDEMLGVPGLREFVREAALPPFSEMMEGILARVDSWRKGPPSDDVSLVLVEVN
jgi:phosphoserine phosphatase RsbU/P